MVELTIENMDVMRQVLTIHETRKPRIFLIGDDGAAAAKLGHLLEKRGHTFAHENSGEKAQRLVDEFEPDVVLLNCFLPDQSGLDVCRNLRRKSKTFATPIIMLSPYNNENDKIRSLNAGADAYVAKPFSIATLAARISALLRRSRSNQKLESPSLHFYDLVFVPNERRAQRKDRIVHLGPTEYLLLEFLLRHPNRIISYEEMRTAIWCINSKVEKRTIGAHFQRLRKAMHEPGEPNFFQTVRSIGFSLDIEPRKPSRAEKNGFYT